MPLGRPPVVNYLMVSYMWNFFAEAALRSLPGDTSVYVIHNGKTKNRADLFSQNQVRKQWYVKENAHGRVLDIVWSSSYMREIRECDVLIMLDHDCYFGESFKEREKQLVDAIMSGHLIAGKAASFQYFLTFPMFAVRPIEHWPADWQTNYSVKALGTNGICCDTGQYIAKLLPKEWICNIKRPDWCFHWGSWYTLIDDIKKHPKRYRDYHGRYERLLCSGLWHPNTEELEEMDEYTLLKQAVQSYRDKLIGVSS